MYKLLKIEQGECLQCGKEIYGRPDKRFCNLSCKNAYHNNIAHEARKMKNEIISSLNKNYDILVQLLKNDIRTISIVRIREIGFNDEVVSGYRRGLYGHVVEECFDISYCRTGMKIFKIRKKQ